MSILKLKLPSVADVENALLVGLKEQKLLAGTEKGTVPHSWSSQLNFYFQGSIWSSYSKNICQDLRCIFKDLGVISLVGC